MRKLFILMLILITLFSCASVFAEDNSTTTIGSIDEPTNKSNIENILLLME